MSLDDIPVTREVLHCAWDGCGMVKIRAQRLVYARVLRWWCSRAHARASGAYLSPLIFDRWEADSG